MSILNAITLGGAGAWTAVENTTASATAISFPVAHEPTEWAIVRATEYQTTSSTKVICYIGESGGTYYEWGMYYDSQSRLSRDGTPTGSYNSGTFTVTRGTASFSTTVGDYILIYI